MTRAPLVDAGATIACAHGGRGLPTVQAPRVAFGGSAALTIDTPLVVAGCAAEPACTGGDWLTGTTRVMASGRPLVTAASGSVCTPTGTPLTIVTAQTRVTAV